jgi:hypothetical protein
MELLSPPKAHGFGFILKDYSRGSNPSNSVNAYGGVVEMNKLLLIRVISDVIVSGCRGRC